jgi:hypothetical protein
MFRVADLAFGSGRFKCLGRTIAMMELNKIFAEVRWLVACLLEFTLRVKISNFDIVSAKL